MGNFYTNFTIFGTDADKVIELARELNCSGYVAKMGKDAVLFDKRCDEQDVAEIESLGKALSLKLAVPVFGCLNHDDDVLLLWLFRGNQRASYQSIFDAPKFAWSLSRLRGGLPTYPLILAVLAWPTFIFQIFRHQMLGGFVLLPSISIGWGYNYLSKSTTPINLPADSIEEI